MDNRKQDSLEARARKVGSEMPEKKVEKIISGSAKVKKKSELRKFADIFISDDVDSIKTYIVMDVLIPSIKKSISDIVINGIDMLLYGTTGVSKRGSSTGGSKVSYRSYYDDRRSDRRDYEPYRSRQTSVNYDDIILDDRREAEEVLIRMEEYINSYEIVTVADLHDLVGITGNYTDNKYGWTDLRSAQIIRVRDGWMLKLPKASAIN